MDHRSARSGCASRFEWGRLASAAPSQPDGKGWWGKGNDRVTTI